MSKALVCDRCGETLALNAQGESDDGEDSAWIRLGLANEWFDLCTRSCVAALLEDGDLIAAHDGYVESITGIARVIQQNRKPTAESDET